MLTIRGIQIIQKMLPLKNAIRIKDLAEEFHVSTRTIKYDLEHIRVFLEQYKITFHSKSNKGIWLEYTQEQHSNMMRVLAKVKQENLYAGQESRITRILFYLFSRKGYTTAYDLSCFLEVSRNTIISDFDLIEAKLKESGVVLSRRQRVGYKLDGEEIHIRLFFESLIQKSLSVYDIFLMTERIKTGEMDEEFTLPLDNLFLSHYKIIEPVLTKVHKENKDLFTQKNDLLTFIIRLWISISRLKLGFVIGDFALLKHQEEKKYILSQFYGEICEAMELPVLHDEFSYLKGTFGLEESDLEWSVITSRIVEYVSSKEEFPYHKDSNLYANLLAHLTLKFEEVGSDNLENPFYQVIIKEYYTLFLSVKEACLLYIGDRFLLSQESFISFIALYFIISYKNSEKNKKLKAVFVCATGRGAAKLIERKIMSQIQEIDIMECCSLLMADDVIKEFEPDIILSIFPIKSHIPVIIVESLPTKENIALIQKVISEKIGSRRTGLHGSEDFFLEDSKYAEGDCEAMSQEMIISGLTIYHHLLEDAKLKIKQELSFAFMTHCMLLAHRIFFKKQYVQHNLRNTLDEVPRVIKAAFEEMQILIEMAEVIAISQYISEEGREDK